MKIKFLPLFYFFILVAFNAKSQGGVLPLNTSVNGTITNATGDTWNITTTSDGLLRFKLTTVSPTDLYITVYDNDGTTAVSGTVESYNNSTVILNADGLSAGTYHVKITPFNTSYGSYTLADSLFTSALANDMEPNAAPASALVVPLNGSTTGHTGYYYNNLRDTVDWYKVTTNADGLLRIYLSTERSSVYSTNTLDVNVSLYDNDGTTQLGAMEVFNSGGPATNVITTDGLQPGTYYIKVQPYSLSEFAVYTISDSLFTPSIVIDQEPNGAKSSAVVLPLNGSQTGHVGYYYNKQRDTTDWYKVTTTADGLLRVYLTTARGSAYSTNTLDVNVLLYDNDGTTQLGAMEVFNAGGPATNTITTDGLQPGTYYIKVQPYTAAEFADYTISDTLFTPPLPNDAEPNGSRGTAAVLSLNASQTGHVGYHYNNQSDTTDWYKVTTNADGLLRVYLTTARGSVYSSNTLDVNVWLYDNDGTTQLGSMEVFNAGGPGTNVITTDGLAPGTYYVKVQSYTTSEFAGYTIVDSLFTPVIPNDAEPNGTYTTAINFPLNSYAKGHSGYYYNNARDTTDWYKVTTLTSGALYFYLHMQRGSVYSNNTLDMIMTVYNSNGTTQIGSKEIFNAGAPGTDSLFFATLAAGTYYVQINSYSAAEFANYTLSITTTQGAVLPVTFINFDGSLLNNQALLKWSTATQLNNKGFEVERSTDGTIFIPVGFVPGNGTTSLVNNYSFTDNKIVSGFNFYRLKQIDLDGKFNYSSTIRLDFKNFAWAVFGNPVTNNSWIQLQISKTSNVAIQIFTAEGRLIKTIDKGTIAQGTYSVPLNLDTLAKGIYVIRLVVDNQGFSKTVIK